MNRPTKRQRLQCPPSWLDVASLERNIVLAPVKTAAPEAQDDGLDRQLPQPDDSDGKNVSSTDTTETTQSSAENNVVLAQSRRALGDGEHERKVKKQWRVHLLSTPAVDSVACQIFLNRFRKEILDPFQINLSGNPLSKKKKHSAVVSIHTANPKNSEFPTQEPSYNHQQQKQYSIFRQRIAVGVNMAARFLESKYAAMSETANGIKDAQLDFNPVGISNCESVQQQEAKEAAKLNKIRGDQNHATPPSPLLVVLVSAGLNSEDTLCFAHIPTLCFNCGVPLLLLPNEISSSEDGSNSAGDVKAEPTGRKLGKLLGIRRASVVTFLGESSPSPPTAHQLERQEKDRHEEEMDETERTMQKTINSFIEYSKTLIPSINAATLDSGCGSGSVAKNKAKAVRKK